MKEGSPLISLTTELPLEREIEHSPRFSIHNTSERSFVIASGEEAHLLSLSLLSGIPKNWLHFDDSYRISRTNFGILESLKRHLIDSRNVYERDNQGRDVNRSRYFYVSPDHRYFAKEKWSQPEVLRRSPWYKHRFFKRQKREVQNRVISLTSEFELSEIIKSALKSDRIQQGIKVLGLKGIRYIPPLLGFIDKNTGIRTVVYEFIEGENLSAYAQIKPELVKSIIELLYLGFKEFGIEPNDLNADQIILGKDNSLYLFDTDYFVPLSK